MNMSWAYWRLIGCWIALLSAPLAAELREIEDQELSAVTGQSGIILSGDITINENGGPLQNAFFGDCTDQRNCGARIAFQGREGGGFFVFDDIRGRFTFDGLSLRTRTIDSGFGGDGEAFNSDVIEIGLPVEVEYDDVSFSFATSNFARPTDPGFQQTDIFSFEIDGRVQLQGNVLVFPTGAP